MAVEQEIKRTTGAIKNVVNPFEIPNVVLEVDTPNGKSIKVEVNSAPRTYVHTHTHAHTHITPRHT